VSRGRFASGKPESVSFDNMERVESVGELHILARVSRILRAQCEFQSISRQVGKGTSRLILMPESIMIESTYEFGGGFFSTLVLIRSNPPAIPSRLTSNSPASRRRAYCEPPSTGMRSATFFSVN